MNNKQINTAIAEACGWKPTTDGGICWDCNGAPIVIPPDYCNDLNAMHEAEKVLNRLEQDQYWDHLKDMTCEGFDQLHSNSRQRAEAFLRTIDKWKEARSE